MTALIYAAFIASSSDGQAAEWVMDTARSKLEFVVQIQSNPFKGAFETFQAQIDFDPSDPSSGAIEISVETGSISTWDDESNTLAGTPEWLDNSNFPIAQFHSTSIESMGSNRFVAAGFMTIKEASVPITLEFTLDIDGTDAIASGSATLTRSELGVGGPFSDSMPVADTVVVEFSIHASERR